MQSILLFSSKYLDEFAIHSVASSEINDFYWLFGLLFSALIVFTELIYCFYLTVGYIGIRIISLMASKLRICDHRPNLTFVLAVERACNCISADKRIHNVRKIRWYAWNLYVCYCFIMPSCYRLFSSIHVLHNCENAALIVGLCRSCEYASHLWSKKNDTIFQWIDKNCNTLCIIPSCMNFFFSRLPCSLIKFKYLLIAFQLTAYE